MGTFDYQHHEEMKESLFPKYNRNKFIDEHIACVIDGDIKLNIILGRYLNK